jgi:hypothetical protein
LTVTGTTAKILDGSSNALSTFANNTGSFTLSGNALLTTASSNFTNSGTVDVVKGSTLTVGGTGHSYTQSAGTTTVDGTLSGGTTGTVTVTAGTLQGAGTVKGNTSNSGIVNVGDAGKAGLLSITGTYTQLSSGSLNVSIGGTTVGTQYSQLKVTGTASLGGTLTVGLINSFTPTIGQTFTILSAHSISGTFTNSTIAINSGEQFDVSYTSTGVVLTVVATTPSNSSNSSQPVAQLAVAATKSALSKPVAVAGTLRHPITVRGGGVQKPILVAGVTSHALAASNLRSWEHVPTSPSWNRLQGVSVTRSPLVANLGAANLGAARSDLAQRINGGSGTIPVRGTLAGLSGVSNSHRIPVRTFTPQLPKVR